ncbi:MAG TPA: T9SS type A sorting domain-containing protein, partial [Ignavibacteriaceae bacterium]|nr:T9SS type A sorting domain-containing protein [Ignavibacteriaceae bacterium]
DVGKIKGWDSGCADPAWTGATDDIPGWVSADTAWDSGVETNYGPTDGIYTAFLMARDTSVYQITDHSIESGEQISLFVDAHLTYLGTLLEMKLFYVDSSGSFVDLVVESMDLTSDMTEYSVSFKASDFPASVGNKLGISFDNITGTANSWLGLDNVHLISSAPTIVKAAKLNPTDYSLSQNYPNPFNPQTRIDYQVPQTANVSISVYNGIGQLVTVLVDEMKNPGKYSVSWNAKNQNGVNLPSGLYLARFVSNDYSATRKLILLK